MSPSADPAARPLRADARRNRERILRAAEVEFAEAGGDAQMDAIATRAGVGIGTVYRHFPTKQALVAEMVRQRFEAMAADARAALAHPEPWAAFAGFMWACAERCEQDAGTQHLFAVVDRELADRLALSTGLDALGQELIDRGVAAGEIRPDFVAAEIGMLMCGVSASMGFEHPVWSWRRHLEITLDGLRARPA